MKVNKTVLKQLLLPGVAGALLVFIFVGIVGSALHKPVAKDVPIAIMAPAEVVKQINTAVRAQTNNMVDLRSTDNVETAKTQLKKQEIKGILAPGQQGFDLYLTSASGEATRQIVTQFGNLMAQAYGQQLQTNDLTPNASGPGHFMVIMFLFMLSAIAALIMQVIIRRNANITTLKMKLGTVVAGSILIGLSGALAGLALGEFKGAFFAVAGITALSVLASSSIIGACSALFGRFGLAAAGFVLIPLGVATSGALVSTEFLPKFYASFAQYMPSAATVDALRSGVYLDGFNIGRPLMVLGAWIVGGLVLIFANFAIRRQLAKKGSAKKAKTTGNSTKPKAEKAATKEEVAKAKKPVEKRKPTKKKATK